MAIYPYYVCTVVQLIIIHLDILFLTTKSSSLGIYMLVILTMHDSIRKFQNHTTFLRPKARR